MRFKKGFDMKVLIELGVEELPAWPFLREFDNILPKWDAALAKHNFKADFKLDYTPRRIVLSGELAEFAPDKEVENIGAPKNVALDSDGKWSKSALAFASKCGISESELAFKEIKGKEVLYHKSIAKGVSLKSVLASIIEDFALSLSFGKTMRWGDKDCAFIRPLRNLVVLLDDELLECELFGVRSNKASFVHRDFGYDKVSFDTAAQYFEVLEKNAVILSSEERKSRILAQFDELEKQSGLKIERDAELLAEVVAITEYPNAHLGSFDKEFLEVPKEVIITSMKENQRYFALLNNDGSLANRFVVVANSTSKDSALIVAGNEKVLRARLSDAQFFWHSDLKNPFNAEKLKNITYLAGLGSVYDKELRECEISAVLADIYSSELKALGASKELLKEAIMLSKADLATAMVYEFTDLQGIMGGYYAKHAGKNELICKAIREQYLPNSDESELPSNAFSSVVAMSAKLDALLALFSINKIPSGTKDPYALRRAALGVIKIALKLGVNFDIKELLAALSKNYKSFELETLYDFILDRLYALYEINPSIIKACINAGVSDLVQLDANIRALDIIVRADGFEVWFDTFKRLANILKEAKIGSVDESLLENESEKALYSAFRACKLDFSKPSEYLGELFGLKGDIDSFFDSVMINDPDERKKANRIALIGGIYEAFIKIADIKEISA